MLCIKKQKPVPLYSHMITNVDTEEMQIWQIVAQLLYQHEKALTKQIFEIRHLAKTLSIFSISYSYHFTQLASILFWILCREHQLWVRAVNDMCFMQQHKTFWLLFNKRQTQILLPFKLLWHQELKGYHTFVNACSLVCSINLCPCSMTATVTP
jgi:hypothetical protein